MFASRTRWRLAPNRFTAALEQQRAAGRHLLDLTESNPTRCGFQYNPQLLQALATPLALEYHPDPKGLLSARQAVARYYADRGAHVSPAHIILTASTSEAYSYLFRLLCEPGDEILVPAPSYPLFEFLAAVQDVNPVSYPLFYDYGWHIDLHRLIERITARTRAILMVHPNNPTGSYVPPYKMESLSILAAERKLALVVDEVFLDYAHDREPRPTFATNAAVLTFTLSGLSKIAALPQMKAAWLVASGPEDAAQPALERLEVIADTYLSINTPAQLALPAFLDGRHAIQQQILTRLEENLGELDRQLAAPKACQRLDLDGGWYAVLRIPATTSDEEIAVALLEQHSVVVHPGHFYDFASDGYLVLSLITPPAIFRDGLSRLLGFLG